VRAVRRLQVGLRVPVRVVEDDGVGRGERQAEPARARRQKEDERAVLVGGTRAGVDAALEGAHRLPALLGPRGAVEPLVSPAAQREVILEHVEHARRLTEEQHLVAARAQPVQQPVKERELGGGGHEVLAL